MASFRVAVYNAISARGLERFPAPRYAVGKAIGEPDAILLRSHALADCGGCAIHLPEGFRYLAARGKVAEAISEFHIVFRAILHQCGDIALGNSLHGAQRRQNEAVLVF